MYNFFIDLIIWTFAIYGFLKFIDEFWLNTCCKIIEIFLYIMLTFKKFIAKFCG